MAEPSRVADACACGGAIDRAFGAVRTVYETLVKNMRATEATAVDIDQLAGEELKLERAFAHLLSIDIDLALHWLGFYVQNGIERNRRADFHLNLFPIIKAEALALSHVASSSCFEYVG